MVMRAHIQRWMMSCYVARNSRSRQLFLCAVYLWFLMQALWLTPIQDLLWGGQNIFYRHGFDDGILQNVIYRLVYDPTLFPWIWWTHVIACIASCVPRVWAAIPRILVWLTGWMLYYAAYRVFNSGMLLMLLLACYGIFMHPNSRNTWLILTTNLFAGLSMFQIVWVYFSSAIYKWLGTQWVSGSAIYYALNIDRFNDYSLDWSIGWICVCTMVITWLVLLFQTLFPVLIWVKSWKKTMLWFGVLLHIGVGVFLHLWDFALAMLAAYTLFLNDEDWSAFMKRFRGRITSTRE